MRFLQWIKTSFEDHYGHVSHRKMTVFFFSKLTLLMVILTFIRNNPNLFPELVWISVITGALGMSYLRKKSIEDEINQDNKNIISTLSDKLSDSVLLKRKDPKK